ncbi:MAG TPA: hypothetical protein VN633_11835 [Bryobacteraceae bacterium]|nr:hypothetical protein [Bryobacteraceae bacterium]
MNRGVVQISLIAACFCLFPGIAQAAWRTADLTSMTGAPPTFTPSLTSYTLGETEHVVFVDSQNHLRVVSRPNSGAAWTAVDATASAGGQPITQTFLTSYAIGNIQNIVYVGAASHLHLLSNANFEASWHDRDLTALDGAPAFGGWLTSYTSGSEEHIVYADAAMGDVQDLHRTDGAGAWQMENISSATGIHNGAFNLTTYTAGTNQHILYVDEYLGHVHDIARAGNLPAWTDTDLTLTLNLPLSYSHSVFLSGYSLGNEEHIFGLFFNTGQSNQPSTLFELYRPNANSNWQAYNVQASVNLPQPLQPFTSLESYTVANSQHVVYIDSSQHVHEICLPNPGPRVGWQSDPTSSAHAPVAASNSPLTSYVTGGIQHVFYIDENSHLNVVEANWLNPWN